MLPVALVVLAVVLGWMGSNYVFSSTPTPPVPNNPSNVSVYTSDPKAAVELVLFPAYNSTNDTLPGFQWVDFNFRVQAENGPVWWALALGGDAAPPPGELPDSGILPTPSGERHDVCCHEVPVGRTYFYNPSTTAIDAPAFVTRVNWPALGEGEGEGEEEDQEATIIYGRHPEGGDFAVSLAVKVRKPLMQDNGGEYVTISSPRLGWTDNQPPREPPVSERLSNLQDGESRQGDAASLENPSWYKPKRMQGAAGGL
jgi:hypothetical protein